MLLHIESLQHFKSYLSKVLHPMYICSRKFSLSLQPSNKPVVQAPVVVQGSGQSGDKTKNKKVQISTDPTVIEAIAPAPVIAEETKNSTDNEQKSETVPTVVISEKSKNSSTKKDKKSTSDSPKGKVNKEKVKSGGRKAKTKLKTVEVGDDAVVSMIVDVVDVCAANVLSVQVDPKDIVENISCLASTSTSNVDKIRSNSTKEETAKVEKEIVKKVESCRSKKQKSSSQQKKQSNKKTNKGIK